LDRIEPNVQKVVPSGLKKRYGDPPVIRSLF
jgi:hypothetical protein